jgi:protein-tyrosine phosphatase
MADEAGIADLEVDSAGTGGWHVGDPADERAAAAAARRGYQLTGTARQVSPDDFNTFDLILAVDEDNLQRLRERAPAGSRAEIRMLADDDVPDPYYGGPDGFDAVLDMIEKACAALLDELRLRQD